MTQKGTIEYFAELYDEEIARTTKGKPIRAKTIGQREYIQAIRHRTLFSELVLPEQGKHI